jgi:hypothetical protein
MDTAGTAFAVIIRIFFFLLPNGKGRGVTDCKFKKAGKVDNV